MEFTNPARAAAAALGLVLALTLVGCGADGSGERAATVSATTSNQVEPPQTAPAAPSVAATRAAKAARRKAAAAAKPVVILISVDGLNPSAITLLDRSGRVPTFHKLIAEGTSTLNARTAYEQTNTLPNHTGLLTGRPITGTAGHHVTFNKEHRGTLATVNRRYVPGVFDPVHDAGLSTAFLAEKSKFAFLVRSWNATGGAKDRTGADNGRNKLDVAKIDTASVLTRLLLSRLTTQAPNFTFLHIAAADNAGHGDHTYGFMGPKYLDAVARIDKQLARIVNAVNANPALKARTTILLTADHGGRGTDAQAGLGHRNPKVLANYRIPFIAWGHRIAAGGDLYALNGSARKNPGKSRPTYAGTQPIRNLDATDLVLSLFGLKPLPGTLPGGRAVLRVR